MFHQAQATDYIDLLLQLEDLAANSHVNSIAINAAGTGWAVGDLFDINGGTVVNGLNATGEILAETAGVPSAIRLYNGGAYTVSPGVGATTTALGASTGVGLTVDATILATGWIVDRSQVYAAPERELIMHGSGVGTDEIYIGIQTRRNSGAGVFYWELNGLTGYDVGETFDNQPGGSRLDAGADDLSTPLNNGIIDYWFVIDTYHIKGVFKSGSSYTNCYLGFINQFDTKAEYPYPLLIVGCSSAASRDVPYNSSTDFMSGMHDPKAFVSADSGPAALRGVDGAWYGFKNSYSPGTQPSDRIGPAIYPAGDIALNSTHFPDAANRFNTTIQGEIAAYWFGGYTAQGGTPAYNLDPTPDTGGDIQYLWPTVIWQVNPGYQFLGEMIDVHPIFTKGLGAVSEDTFTLPNGDTFIVFQNCNRTDTWATFAIKRNF